MGRLVLATVVGAVVLWAWGSAAWMFLGLHDDSLRSPPDEARLTAALKAQPFEHGFYYLPKMPDNWRDKDQMQAYRQRYQEGPAAYLVIHPSPGDPMPASMMAIGLALHLAAAFFAALILQCGQIAGPIRRWILVMAMGAFTVILSDASAWNWMLFPLDFTLAMAADKLIGSALLGLVMALILRPAKPAAQPASQPAA